MLTLSEFYSDTIELNPSVSCDFSLSESVLAPQTEKTAVAFFQSTFDKLPAIWSALSAEIADNPWIVFSRQPGKSISLSILLVSDPEIHALNREFRDKDSATDVLTFTLGDDAEPEAGLTQLPEVNLGEIYLSLDWALREVCQADCNDPEANAAQAINFSSGLSLFLLERLVHGCLHLMGVHHDTIPDYNKVIAIQRLVLHALS